MTDLTPRRPRGRPPKPPGEKGVRVETLLDPELHRAWRADGRPLNVILREALLGAVRVDR